MSSAILSPASRSGIRPSTVTSAVWITVLTNLLSYGVFLLPGSEQIPVPAIIFGTVVAAATLALCWWTWNLKRWAVIALTIVSLLNMISSLPGIFAWPSTAIGVSIIIGIPLTLVPIWLLWHPASRRAYR